MVGYAGLDNEGLAGLELQYESALSGRDGAETIVRDPFGRMLDVVEASPAREGKDIHVSLDQRLQAQVEQVRDVAGAGESMPPKSTYFFPKVLTGMVFNPLTD